MLFDALSFASYQLVTVTAAFIQTQQCPTSAYEHLQKSLTVEQTDSLPWLRKLKENQDKQFNAAKSVCVYVKAQAGAFHGK